MTANEQQTLRALATRPVADDSARALADILQATEAIRAMSRLPLRDEPVHAALAAQVGALAVVVKRLLEKP